MFIKTLNPLNAELNPICHLLALLGTHHILQIGSIRVKKHIQANIWTKKHDLCREFDDNSSLLGHDTMQTGIQLTEFCSRLMYPMSGTKSKKTLMCQSKKHYIPNGLNLQQHHRQNQKFCRDFINRGKCCDVYISSGIDRILIMEMRWAEHLA
jgi:hypothetical protein